MPKEFGSQPLVGEFIRFLERTSILVDNFHQYLYLTIGRVYLFRNASSFMGHVD